VNTISKKIALASLAACLLVYLVIYVKWQDQFFWIMSAIGFSALIGYIVVKGFFAK